MSTLRINAFERRQNLTLSQSFLTFGTPHKTPKFARHLIELASVTDPVKVCLYFPRDAELLYKERCYVLNLSLKAKNTRIKLIRAHSEFENAQFPLDKVFSDSPTEAMRAQSWHHMLAHDSICSVKRQSE